MMLVVCPDTARDMHQWEGPHFLVHEPGMHKPCNDGCKLAPERAGNAGPRGNA